MEPPNARTILIAILVITSISTLFCLISLATPGWVHISIFSLGHSSTAALSIISLLLLIGCIIVASLILTNVVKHERLPIIFVTLLIVTSIFLLATFGSFFGASFYSYNLMITSFAFTYLSSLLAVYWLLSNQSNGQKSVTPTTQTR
ncbi:unnamed protein product [Rotaria magnacalcarata]|uniref:Uncharacterized protein n=1 Tax=Rotaria magnacalcarata TaxID=392030 RepID=A0A814EK09_9BILA|nr:unnamed protein product [Rotaria magnacalcarata]CAF1353574.1 unnamed protein product [Rotaria magnacalcarata]CAF2048495.1 unnamed protein product [Rotaria magnacalcarata]CAF4334226.1 unnamed protein product [Rotaria magnacalcarata]CAF4952064.1 unnamed protein product [Rotaria magnacalcarata]